MSSEERDASPSDYSWSFAAFFWLLLLALDFADDRMSSLRFMFDLPLVGGVDLFECSEWQSEMHVWRSECWSLSCNVGHSSLESRVLNDAFIDSSIRDVEWGTLRDLESWSLSKFGLGVECWL